MFRPGFRHATVQASSPDHADLLVKLDIAIRERKSAERALRAARAEIEAMRRSSHRNFRALVSKSAEASLRKLNDDFSAFRENWKADLEKGRVAQEELRKARAALAKEFEQAQAACKQQEVSQAAMNSAEAKLAHVSDDFLESQQALDAERERSESLSRRADELEERLSAARVEQECTEATLENARKELVFLRREANRAHEIEGEPARKTLRLKQKDAEARALALDVKCLTESLSYKGKELTDGLRQSHLKMPSPSCLSSTFTSTQNIAPLDYGLGKQRNVVVLELGAWRVRVGVVMEGTGTEGGNVKSFFENFPCCIARPTRGDAGLVEIVNGASSLAAPMYAKFRETGVFVGGDAWYCCLDHPSIALRSKLRMSSPMQRGKKLSREDTHMLMAHAFGTLNQDSSCTPTLLTYKSTATEDEVLEMASVLLEAHRVPSIRMVNEAEVAALAVGLLTGVLVDIGESGFSVTPIFGGCPIAPGARWEACGGADLTEFMDTMLHSRANEQFNQMTDRRRLEMSRELKEELCYVPLDFNVEVEEHGSFRQKVMRICKGARISPKLSQYESCDSDTFLEGDQEDARITTTKSFTLKSGDELMVTLGRERFHAPEILFTSRLWNDRGLEASKGLPEVVMDALTCVDTDTMAEMLGDVVVVGGSAALEGLGDRLEEELKAMLPEALANRVEVRVPSRADLQHRNPLSRCSPSAVIVGTELLLEREGVDGEPWITATSWAEHPEALTAALAPFVRDDSGRGKRVP